MVRIDATKEMNESAIDSLVDSIGELIDHKMDLARREAREKAKELLVSGKFTMHDLTDYGLLAFTNALFRHVTDDGPARTEQTQRYLEVMQGEREHP